MKLEQRFSIRKNLAVGIVVNYDFTYSQMWKVKDLSMSGAFIDGEADDLPSGAAVEAVLLLKSSEGIERHRVPAKVVRVSADGAALQFGEYDNQTYGALVDLLYTRP